MKQPFSQILFSILIIAFAADAFAIRDTKYGHDLDPASGKSSARRAFAEGDLRPTRANPDQIFEKFVDAYEALTKKMDGYARDVQAQYQAKQASPEPLVPVALLMELKRLHSDRSFVEMLRKKEISREEWSQVMVEKLVVMQFLDYLTTYGSELTKVALDPQMKKLSDAEKTSTAARNFGKQYPEDLRKKNIFGDDSIVRLATNGNQFKLISEKLFGEETNQTADFRETFFKGFASNLYARNKEAIEAENKKLSEQKEALEKKSKTLDKKNP